MKLLMIGMDGASRKAFSRGWTPYTEELLQTGHDLSLKTDLYSRGWLEIATGEHASTTGATYDQPKCDGTVDWIEKFRITDIPGYESRTKSLWRSVNELGLSVGVMNLPTTFPAPEVNGFFVSGGGGGAPVVSRPTREFCYPPEILEGLLDDDYIVDERVVQLVLEQGRNESASMFDRLAYENTVRTGSFIRLCREHHVDFGFVVYKTSSVLAENIAQAALVGQASDNQLEDSATLSALKKYYNQFDKEIEKLHKAFPEAEILFVADHGMALRTHSVNPNVFLVQHGFQEKASIGSPLFSISQFLRRKLPFRLKKALTKRGRIRHIARNTVAFNVATTKAFCRTFGDWRYGIYINDTERFGGPVSGEHINAVAMQIAEELNSLEAFTKHGIRAEISQCKNLLESTSPEWYPDITIEVPDGYLVTDKTERLVEGYELSEHRSGLDLILKGGISSIKSTSPVSVYCGERNSDELSKPSKLTSVHNLVIELLSSEPRVNNQSM